MELSFLLVVTVRQFGDVALLADVLKSGANYLGKGVLHVGLARSGRWDADEIF